MTAKEAANKEDATAFSMDCDFACSLVVCFWTKGDEVDAWGTKPHADDAISSRINEDCHIVVYDL